MGAGGMHPNQPYGHDFNDYSQPYHNHGVYPPSNHINHMNQMPTYGFGAYGGRGYGRGFQQPNYPMHYGHMAGGMRPGFFPPPSTGPGYFSHPRAGTGGLQSAPPSATYDGNIHIHPPGGSARPHFDDQ